MKTAFALVLMVLSLLSSCLVRPFRLQLKSPLLGRQLLRSFSSSNAEGGDRRIVFVGNLPLDYSLKQLDEFASLKGIVDHTARIAVDRKGKFRGFGFLDFRTPNEALDASELLQGCEIDGRALKIDLDAGTDGPDKGRRPSIFSDDKSIFIGNLDFGMGKNDIQKLIEGEVGAGVKMRIRIAQGDNSKSKGFCHVDFAEDEMVEEAINKMHKLEVNGRMLTVAKAYGKPESVDGGHRSHDYASDYKPRGRGGGGSRGREDTPYYKFDSGPRRNVGRNYNTDRD